MSVCILTTQKRKHEQNSLLYIILYSLRGVEPTLVVLTVLARQPSRAADSLLRSSRGGGMGTPSVYGKQAVGTYIYSLLYTHTGLLGRLP